MISLCLFKKIPYIVKVHVELRKYYDYLKNLLFIIAAVLIYIF